MSAGAEERLTKWKVRVSRLFITADPGLEESIAVVVSITTIICVVIIILYCYILKFKNYCFNNCIITYIGKE